MAIAVGGGGPQADINVTPLIAPLHPVHYGTVNHRYSRLVSIVENGDSIWQVARRPRCQPIPESKDAALSAEFHDRQKPCLCVIRRSSCRAKKRCLLVSNNVALVPVTSCDQP